MTAIKPVWAVLISTLTFILFMSAKSWAENPEEVLGRWALVEDGMVAEILSYDTKTQTFDLRSYISRGSQGSSVHHHRLRRENFKIQVSAYLNFQVGMKYVPPGSETKFTLKTIYEDGTAVFEKKTYKGSTRSMQIRSEILSVNIRMPGCQNLLKEKQSIHDLDFLESTI